MTLPILIQKHQKQVLHNQFKKAYTELNQASHLFLLNEGISVTDFDTNSTPQKVIEKFMTYYQNSHINTAHPRWEKITGDYIPGNPPCDEGGLYQWEDDIGRYYQVDNGHVSQNQLNGPKICIDINGEKGPNKLGYDYFIFIFLNNGQIAPYTGGSFYGQTRQRDEIFAAQNCSFDNLEIEGGLNCAYFALINKNPYGNGDYWNDFLK